MPAIYQEFWSLFQNLECFQSWSSLFEFQFLKNFRQSIVFKYAERTTGDSYNVVDVMATLDLKSFEISVIGNNIFNTEYTETNLVPMPKGNILLDIKYKF